MTLQPCDMCGNPSETPTCLRCQAECQRVASATARATTARATGAADQAAADIRRRQRLNQARIDLGELPGFVDTLARCLTEPPPAPVDGSGGGGKPASKPPLRLEVLHLVDEREKPTWWGEDPRDAQLGDRYGVAWQLHAWSRVVWEEWGEYAPPLAEHPTAATESAYLLAAFGFITAQRWAGDLASDVSALAARCRVSLGIRREYRPSCRYCGDVVEPVNTEHETTNWQAYAYALCRGCGWQYRPGAELLALGQVQPPQSLRDISEATSIPHSTLYRWAAAKAIVPAPESPRQPTKTRPALFDLAAVQAVATRLSRRPA